MRKSIFNDFSRELILLLGFILIFILIAIRLIYLQVIKHNYYLKVAEESHYGITELPARRGEIILDDPKSGKPYKLATTTTYNLLFADPSIISKDDNAKYLASQIAPIIFDLEKAQEEDRKRVKKLQNEAQTEEDKDKINEKSDNELLEDYTTSIEEQMNQYIRKKVLLLTEVDPELEKVIQDLDITGIEIDDAKNLAAYPERISSASKTAKQLYEIINFDRDYLEVLLEGKNHYTVLTRKLSTEKTEELEKLIESDDEAFAGIKLSKEHYRFYPEGELASEVLGYVNAAGMGFYGIEGRYNHILLGRAGFIQSQKDATGEILTVGDSKVQIAQDGADITLTIDRSIQLELEKNLVAAIDEYGAEAAQAIVMNPKTGEVLAMANMPTFNPNEYNKIYNYKQIDLSQAEIDNLEITGEGANKKMYFYTQRNPDRKFEVFEDTEVPGLYYRYENLVGPEVYKNKTVTDVYEPGSTFKVIAMASAIDAGELEPNTTHYCGGPIKVAKISNPKSESDYFPINTFDGNYHGLESMTEVLENSCNIGMSFVAEKLGSGLFYNYIRKFGYASKTGIEFENESSGRMEHYDYWDRSELLTHGFGQGISVTLIQHVTAIAAIANGGTLLQPYIVKKIEYGDGKIENFEPHIVDQVITKQTADKITSMMVSVTENGQAKKMQVPGHFVAAKTGTAQTYKNGEALFGIGTTITSLAAFGPVDDPQFVVLVKVDKPLNGIYAESSAVQIAQKTMDFLYKYYNIRPDKK